jgi:hypothetical protein
MRDTQIFPEIWVVRGSKDLKAVQETVAFLVIEVCRDSRDGITVLLLYLE